MIGASLIGSIPTQTSVWPRSMPQSKPPLVPLITPEQVQALVIAVQTIAYELKLTNGALKVFAAEINKRNYYDTHPNEDTSRR